MHFTVGIIPKSFCKFPLGFYVVMLLFECFSKFPMCAQQARFQLQGMLQVGDRPVGLMLNDQNRSLGGAGLSIARIQAKLVLKLGDRLVLLVHVPEELAHGEMQTYYPGRRLRGFEIFSQPFSVLALLG